MAHSAKAALDPDLIKAQMPSQEELALLFEKNKLSNFAKYMKIFTELANKTLSLREVGSILGSRMVRHIQSRNYTLDRKTFILRLMEKPIKSVLTELFKEHGNIPYKFNLTKWLKIEKKHAQASQAHIILFVE
jgi:hypothetical protein